MAEGNVVTAAGTWSASDGLGFAFFGGNLRTDDTICTSYMIDTYLSRGSIVVNPIIMPRGIEPGVCRFVRAPQN